MARFYYVDPTVQGQDPLPAIGSTVGGWYVGGTQAVMPSGVTVLSVGQNPDAFMYEVIPDPATPPPADQIQYYDVTTVLHFVANADPLLERVQEEQMYAEKPIQSVYNAQKSNLDAKRDSVLAQGVTVTTSTGVHDLQSAGGMITQYWATNIWTLPVATEVTTVTLNEEGVAIKGTDLDAIATQIGLLYAAGNANWLSLLDEMKALLAADDWLGLANFDIDRGWPAAPGNGTAQQVDISLLAVLAESGPFHARTAGVPQLAELWAHINANLDARADPQELFRRWNARP